MFKFVKASKLKEILNRLDRLENGYSYLEAKLRDVKNGNEVAYINGGDILLNEDYISKVLEKESSLFFTPDSGMISFPFIVENPDRLADACNFLAGSSETFRGDYFERKITVKFFEEKTIKEYGIFVQIESGVLMIVLSDNFKSKYTFLSKSFTGYEIMCKIYEQIQKHEEGKKVLKETNSKYYPKWGQE